jgi:hypothetical protein
VALATPVGAQAPADSAERPTVRIRTYLRYGYELEGSRKNFNEFNIDRLYVEFHTRLWRHGRFRATLEGGDLRETGGTNTPLAVVTKHLYFEAQDLLFRSSYLRFGLTDLPWVAYEEDLWGYRLQGTVFPDRSGYLTSTDLGIAVGSTLPSGLGSWQVNLVNGEGWKAPERGRHKDGHARLTIYPLARTTSGPLSHLFVAGFGSVGTYDTAYAGSDNRRRFIAQTGYHQPGRLTVIGEALWTTDPTDAFVGRYPSLAARAGSESQGRGHSVFGVASASLVGGPNRWAVLGRWDHLDPDDQIASNSLDRYIVGVSVAWKPAMTTIVDVELVRNGAAALKPDESRVMVQTQIRF